MTEEHVAVVTTHRLPRWLRWLLAAGGLVAAAATVFVVWMVAAFSGGFDDLMDLSKPSADDASVRRSRTRAQAEATAELGRLEPLLVSAGAGATLARGHGEGCEVGQHNWKIDDSFDLRCTAREVLVVTSDAPMSVRTELHRSLLSAGWAYSYGPPADEGVGADPHRRSTAYHRGDVTLTVSDGSYLEHQTPTVTGLPTALGREAGATQIAVVVDVHSDFD